jgi:spoIIIJ-associated protein
MKQFEAKTLEEAYELASSDFSCSITSLNIEIIQQPSRGFLGFGKKNAIITASIKQKTFNQKDNSKYTKNKNFKKKIVIEDVATTIANVNTTTNTQTTKPEKKHNFENDPRIEKKEKIFESFYNESDKKPIYENAIVKKDFQEIIDEIKLKVNELFSYSCYEINEIEVKLYDEQTVFIGFTGVDSALLIGKEGYRYKALSYILFNWINTKYNLMLRLEVAQFLENQETAIENYLEPVIEKIKETGSYKTKALDGILVHIALTRLRDEFPDKYVAVKTNIRGDKYILVNEYKKQ